MTANTIEPWANEVEAILYTAVGIDLFGSDVFSKHVGTHVLTEAQCDQIWEAVIPHLH